MDRKQRRGPSPPRSNAAPEVDALFAAAVQHHAAGRLGQAEQLYRRLLGTEPGHAASLHRLGVIAHQRGQFDAATEFLRRAIARDGTVAACHTHLSLALARLGRLDEAADTGATAVRLAPEAADGHVNLGLILLQLGRLDEAADCCRRAVLLAPDLPDVHGNLGAVLQELGRSSEAAESYRRALLLEPDYPEAHTGLGNALLDLGSPDDALSHHRRAIALRPGFAEAHYNLGQALRHAGRLDDAAGRFRDAIGIDPGLVVAHRNLAAILKASGRLAEAEAALRQALAATRDDPELLNDLALTLLAQNRPGEATRAIAQALAVRETPAARRTFVDSLKALNVEGGAESLQPVLLRALSESWARPENLARVSLDIIMQDRGVAATMARANAAWPGPVTETQLYGDGGVLAVAENELLQILLCAMPNADIAFERFLTLARQLLLDSAETGASAEAALGFHGALARQCFLNEYVFRLANDEHRRADALRQRVAAAVAKGERITAAMLLAVGCYFPLASLPLAERLLDRSWPAPVAAVLTQQIVEVREEAALKDEIPRLTPIRDEGSLKVQAQYEESPYPRWLDAGAGDPPQRLADYLIAAFPLSGLQPVSAGSQTDILIAGCGTGRNALDAARAFKGARTLAIDLSAASLAHAIRKTREAGVADLVYAQADLLELQTLGRSFDLIESIGVLHHLPDPMAAWRALLAVLRPGGVMKLGLYSAVARRKLPRMNIGEPSAEAIRDARQSLAARNDEEALEALRAPDFYSLSGCRDLLFHVQETRLTLGEIDALLREADLVFLGFILPDDVLATYRSRFPQDPAAVDLGCWEAFERENPDVFAAMYQFWVQKRPAPTPAGASRRAAL